MGPLPVIPGCGRAGTGAIRRPSSCLGGTMTAAEGHNAVAGGSGRGGKGFFAGGGAGYYDPGGVGE